MQKKIDKDRIADAGIVEQIRLNIAFEEMIISVLTGAGVGGALTFAFGLAAIFFDGGVSPAATVPILFNAVFVAFLIFLVGFFASVIVIVPLYKAMEKSRRRSVWPYLIAALAVAAFILLLLESSPRTAHAGLATIVPVLTAGAAAALVFGRRMRPYWREAAQTEAEIANGARPLH